MAVFTLNRWQIALTLYFIIIGIILIIKPAMMFSKDDSPKIWGVETSEKVSIFSPMIVFPILAILCYYIAVWIELSYA